MSRTRKTHMPSRRNVLLAGAAALAGIPARAQQFPSRPIKLLVGFGAGGSGDILARLYALKISEVLNTPIVVENKPGAFQLAAINPLLSAPADGYTLMLGTGGALVQGPVVRKDLPYDPLKDFTYIAMLTASQGVFIVHPSLPVHTMSELIAYSKANPGKLNYGSAGLGAINHLLPAYIAAVTGGSLTHIPLKSDAELVRDTVAGTLHVSATTTQFAMPMIQEKRVRPIAVTGAQRLKALPEVPTLSEERQEELKGFNGYTFYTLIGPRGMPAAVVEKLNEAANKVSAMPDVTTRLQSLYMEAMPGTPAACRQFVEKELVKWREVGRKVPLEASR